MSETVQDRDIIAMVD